MLLERIILGDREFTPGDFKEPGFINAFREKCIHLIAGENGGIVIAEKSLLLLQGINGSKVLSTQEQIILTCLEIKTEIQIITTGKPSSPDKDVIKHLSVPQMLDLILSSLSEQDFTEALEGLMQSFFNEKPGDSGSITFVSIIEGTFYSIFKQKENGNVTFYIYDKKKHNTVNGYIVDSNGEMLNQLEGTQEVYCFIQVNKNIEIYSGNPDKGFKKNVTLKNTQIKNIEMLYSGIIGIMNDGFCTLKDINTGEVLLEIRRNELSDYTDLGKCVDVYRAYGKYLFIYKGFDDDGQIVYIATENNLSEGRMSKYPIYPIITQHNIHITMYSPEVQLYALINMDNLAVCKIVSYIDDDEIHHIGGSFPEYVTKPNGISQLRFIYYFENEKGEKTYDMGYIYSGIESDLRGGKIRQGQIDIGTVTAFNSMPI